MPEKDLILRSQKSAVFFLCFNFLFLDFVKLFLDFRKLK